MKIGIDARLLGPQNGGLGRYVEQLIIHLQKIDDENQYVIFLRKNNFDRCKITASNFRKVLADVPWYSLTEQWRLPFIIRREQPDIMHFPHWNVPLWYRRPFVLTVHDLIMYHYPRTEASTLGPAAYWLKDKVARLVLRSAARRARHIFVTSEFTRRDVEHTLGVPLAKMTTTYQAPFEYQPPFECRPAPTQSATSDFRLQTSACSGLPGLSEREEGDIRSLISDFGLSRRKLGHQQSERPYILYVGAAYPHKNLEGLLRAWKIFLGQYGAQWRLALAGRKDFFYKRLLASELFHSLPNVTYLEFVSDDELAALYRGASLYVFPSLYEGFGLPPLEAVSCGMPVAASRRTCLPEVLGDAAVYFDPENYEEMARVMHQALTDEALRARLRAAGQEQLTKYSWEGLAMETLSVYKKAGTL